jgi:spermidine/putrescine transport system ATP-binding protein
MKGRVLQVGTPRDIYNHPAERFVADFIGDTNFLSAKVETVENWQDGHSLRPPARRSASHQAEA